MGKTQTASDKKISMFPTKRGRLIPPQGEGGYDQCWYALIPASQVAAGEVVRADFLDGHVAVFRGESGKVAVVSPFCRHLGSDLCVEGKVIGDSLRCPFHHWHYGLDGVCNKLGSGDPIPPGARLFPFPVAEKYGMIWVFNGLDPLYEVPDTGLDDPLAIRVSDMIEIRLDPGLQFMQPIDFQHLSTLHHVEVDKVPEVVFHDYYLEWQDPMTTEVLSDESIPTPRMQAKVWGTCTLVARGELGGIKTAIMFGMTPRPDGVSRGWTISATPKIGDDPKSLEMEAEILAQSEHFAHTLILDDINVLNAISFRQDQLSKSDKVVARYLHYLRNYPRAHPSQDFIVA